MPTEAILGLGLVATGMLAGFIVWLTKISADIGYIRGQITTRLEGVEIRLNHHSDVLDKHSSRIQTLEEE